MKGTKNNVLAALLAFVLVIAVVATIWIVLPSVEAGGYPDEEAVSVSGTTKNCMTRLPY